jgi:hypothetical protein
MKFPGISSDLSARVIGGSSVPPSRSPSSLDSKKEEKTVRENPPAAHITDGRCHHWPLSLDLHNLGRRQRVGEQKRRDAELERAEAF